MDAGALRPLGLGEILDVAIKLYRARFATMAKVVAVFVAPVYVFSALVQLSLLPGDDADVGGTEFWAVVAAAVVTGLAVYLASELATAGSFRVVSGTYLNDETDWRDSVGFATARLGPLVWLTILSGLGMGAVAALGALLAVAVFPLLFLLVLGAVYLYGLWAVAVPALLFEDVRGTRALSRSRQLVRGRWWPVFGTILLATLLAGIVGNIIGGIVTSVVASGDSDVVDAVGGAVGSIVSGIITTPFVAAVTTILYYDLRVRKEGFDLELLARRWDG